MSIESPTVIDTESPRKSGAKRRTWLALLLFLLLIGALLAPLYWRKAHPTGMAQGGMPGPPGMMMSNASAVPVASAKVEAGSMGVYLDALGTVTPLHTASVYSQVSGRVLSVNYTEGQMVTAGQTLIEIDPRPYEALLAQAKGAQARDRANLEQAKVDAKRYQDAYARNAISQQTLFDQQQLVKQYEGTLQNDEGSVKYYEVQLDYCRIVAPFSGRIGLRLVDPGNTIFSGSSNTLAVITQLDPITTVFSIAEDHIVEVQEQLRRAGKLNVDLYDRSKLKKLTSGTLATLDNQIDTTTGTLKARASFRNPNGAVLFPNQFVNARLLVKTIRNAPQIPTSAIQYNGQQAFVYVIGSDHKVSIKNITVTNESDEKSAIDGLEVGTTIATSNFDRLQEGAEVDTNPAARRMPGGGGRP